MVKKNFLNTFFLSILIIGFFLINPILSIILNLYLCYKNKRNIFYIVLIFNLSLINLFRIPHSDYYRYYKYYYYLKTLNLKDFIQTLYGNPDYLFYIQKYICARNGIEFSIWAFLYSLICYIIIYFLSNDLENKKYRLGFFLIINPFNITRFLLAVIICIYVFFKIKKKYLKYLLYLIGILFHKFMIIFLFFEILKKNKLKLNKKRFYISVLVVSILAVLGKKYFLYSLGISTKYYSSAYQTFLDFSFQNLRVKIDFYINMLIIIIYFSIKKCNLKEIKEDNFYRYLLILIFGMYFISNIIVGRLLHVVTFLIIYSLMNTENKFDAKKNIVLGLLLFLQLIIYSDEIRYGVQTNSFPINLEITSMEKVDYYLNEKGHIR